MDNFNNPSTSIKNWAADDRPREKMIANGAATLSNSELLAILINNGSRQKSAVDLAKEILQLGSNNLVELGKLSLKDLQKIKGIGKAKAITIAAALELGNRRQVAATLDKPVVKTSKQIAAFLQPILKDYQHEVFAVLFLNQANKINHFEILSKGGITGTVADPRIILKKALEEDATQIVLCHNHPSGSLKPSQADEAVTQKIKTAAIYFDIKVIDHIIVSEEGYYSFVYDWFL
ncbi:MAG: DNA repair protein RadC [Chitinophagaceae bacterium]|nr:DNA repair protein RadC [Chitinophagaceae bacterium]